MKLLAIETSSERGSVALLADEAVYFDTAELSEQHSRWCLPAVRRLLDRHAVSLRGLDAIAYGAGPGSFTGLRLACGVAQGLAFGAGLSVVGVCSLEALALGTERERCYVAVDARMGEVYFAAYRIVGTSIETEIAPGVAAPSQVTLPEGGGWHGCGTGFASYADALTRRLAASIATNDGSAVPHAVHLARLAAVRVASGAVQDAAGAQPLYIRDKVALTTDERLARGGRA
jgi:tRNA threonylcarbamoyladenosine biosynthesis protein TsaB